MTATPTGHIEQLPSGSWRAKVYVGKDPLTGREIRFRKTRKTEVEAQIELAGCWRSPGQGASPKASETTPKRAGSTPGMSAFKCRL